jgi:hypothetical protein
VHQPGSIVADSMVPGVLDPRDGVGVTGRPSQSLAPFLPTCTEGQLRGVAMYLTKESR